MVQISANLIAQRTKDGRQVLELQEKQRVFEAELPLDKMELPAFDPGSRLQLSGVCDFAPVYSASFGKRGGGKPFNWRAENLAAKSGGCGAVERAAVVDLEAYRRVGGNAAHGVGGVAAANSFAPSPTGAATRILAADTGESGE